MTINSKRIKIKNDFGEDLDCLLEGNTEAENIIIFVHGFGTDKDEGFASFIDLANAFSDSHFILRFDQSGYGASEGDDFAFNFQKAAGDLRAVLDYAREQHPEKKINIIAHSLGTFVTALLSPENVKSIIFTAPPNADVELVLNTLVSRIESKAGVVNYDGVTEYPRSRGGVQKIGRDFWRTLQQFNPRGRFSLLAGKTNLTIFRPMQDDVLAKDGFEEYKSIKDLNYVELNGDHNFTNLEDRKILISKIREKLI